MHARFGVLVLVCALGMAGCGSGTPGPSRTTEALPDVTGNWLLQNAPQPTGTSPAETPLTVALDGALQSTGAQVTGTVKYTDEIRLLACGEDEVVAVTGTVNSASHLSLHSAPLSSGAVVTADLDPPANPPGFWTGSISVSGNACGFPATTAIGVEIPSLSGTYKGNVMASPNTSNVAVGAASLSLTQDSSPEADGEFSTRGTLQYTIGSCTANVPLTGTVSGLSLQLVPVTSPVAGSPLRLAFGAVGARGGSRLILRLIFNTPPCEASESLTYTVVFMPQ